MYPSEIQACSVSKRGRRFPPHKKCETALIRFVPPLSLPRNASDPKTRSTRPVERPQQRFKR